MKKILVILTILIWGSCNSDENLTYGLIGKWKWTFLCGGITGECGYADGSSTRTLEITKDKMVETWNDNSVTTQAYFILSKTSYDEYTEYIVQFDKETTSRMRATKSTLDIEKGDTWTGYKR